MKTTATEITRKEAIALVGKASLLPWHGWVVLADGRRLFGMRNTRGQQFWISPAC